ncbi:MAG: hypothetical protein ACKOCD_04770 [Nitrospiraceae bacterium]
MSRFCFGIVLCAILLLGQAGLTAAADAPANETAAPAIRLKEVNGTFEKRLISKELGVTLSGYLEGSYTQNFNNPSNGINQLRI